MIRSRLVACLFSILFVLLGGPASLALDLRGWRPLYEPGCGGWITSLAVSPHDSRHVLVGGDLLGLAVSPDGGERWLPTFGFLSWEMADITFHPQRGSEIWVGTLSGPHVSLDGGSRWMPRRVGFPAFSDWQFSAPVQKVLFDPRNPMRLLTFGGSHRRWQLTGSPLFGAVWESLDGGASWAKLSTIAGGGNVMNAIFTEPGRLCVAVDQQGVFISADDGRTWQASNEGLPALTVNWVTGHPGQPSTLWLALGNYRAGSSTKAGGIYKSTDGGATWASSSLGLPQTTGSDPNFVPRFETVTVAPSDHRVLYTSDTAWNTAAAYKSLDGGTSWQPVMNYSIKGSVPTAYVAGPGATFIAVAPLDSQIAYFGNSEYVLRTSDGGASWKDVTSAASPHDPSLWRGRGYSGLCAVNFAFNPYRANHAVLIAMDDGKFWQSRDGLEYWRWGGQGMDHWGGGNDVCFAGPGGDIMYATFGQFGSFAGIGRTTDGGQTWTVLQGAAQGLPALWGAGQPVGIHCLPDRPEKVWVTVGGKLYASENSGQTWQKVHDGPGHSWIAADPAKPSTFYVAGENGLYSTVDGQKLDLIPGSPTGINRLRLDPNDPGRLYATVWRRPNGGLWRLEAGKWTRLRDDPYIYDMDVQPGNPACLVVTTSDDPYHDVPFSSGIWLSTDGGVNWRQQNQGLRMTRATVVRFDPHHPAQLVAGTLGGGYFITEIGKSRRSERRRR